MPNLRLNNGWNIIGAHTKPADNRTAKQLLENIDHFAERFPEVAQFKKELKTMNPKHLSLVSDICELTSLDLNGKNINIRELKNHGKSLFSFLMENLPRFSKENPEALNFAQEVINQTDNTASKFFLASTPAYFQLSEAARHLAATRPLIKDIAEATLGNFPRLGYQKEQNFVNVIQEFINPSIKPENIETLSEVLKLAEPQGKGIDVIGFIRNNTNLY